METTREDKTLFKIEGLIATGFHSGGFQVRWAKHARLILCNP